MEIKAPLLLTVVLAPHPLGTRCGGGGVQEESGDMCLLLSPGAGDQAVILAP